MGSPCRQGACDPGQGRHLPSLRPLPLSGRRTSPLVVVKTRSGRGRLYWALWNVQ